MPFARVELFISQPAALKSAFRVVHSLQQLLQHHLFAKPLTMVMMCRGFPHRHADVS